VRVCVCVRERESVSGYSCVHIGNDMDICTWHIDKLMWHEVRYGDAHTVLIRIHPQKANA
jgi:hypothetical protein